MNKKLKTGLISAAIILLIVIIALIIRTSMERSSDELQESVDQMQISQDNDDNSLNDQVLSASDNQVYPTDVFGTWLTPIAESSQLDASESKLTGFVLLPGGEVEMVNNESVEYTNWTVGDYKLTFTTSDDEEISYIIDYVGRGVLQLRDGDEVVEYVFDAKG
jgi:hypothetical protein